MSDLWNRSYKITLGTRAYYEEAYIISYETVTSLTGTGSHVTSLYGTGSEAGYYTTSTTPTTTDAKSYPSNARFISNLVADGYPQRGFTFSFNSSQKVGKADGEVTTLKLYNLDDEMISIINQPKCILIIEAGYDGATDVAYTGDVLKVDWEFSGADVVYTLTCKSGGMALKDTHVSINYAESMTTKEIIQDLISKLPNTSEGKTALASLKSETRTGGKAVRGRLKEILDDLLTKNNLKYAHYNGKIVILPEEWDASDKSTFAKNCYQLSENNIKSAKKGIIFHNLL